MLIDEINNRLKEAMKKNNLAVKYFLREIKSKISEYQVKMLLDRNDITDEIVLLIIKSHKKSMLKAIKAMEGSDRANKLITQYKIEVDMCEEFLTDSVDEETILQWVDDAVSAIGATDIKQAGQVIGYVMKNHKDEDVDGSLVKKAVMQRLNK